MRTRFIALLRILVILSLSCGGPVPRFSVPPVTIPFDREQGFYLLGAYWVDAQDTISFHGQTVDLDGLKVPRAASGPSEFVAAWRKLLFPYPPPSVDFATHVVIFFGAYENLRCGVRPTTALLLTQHADLMPRSPGNYLCERRNVWRYGWHLLPPPDTGIAIRAVAVARAALPRDGVFVGNHGLAFKAPPAAMPPAARAKQEERAGPVAAAGVVDVPSVGETLLQRLEDGTRVWVVRHRDGAMSVLAGDFPIVHAAVGTPYRFVAGSEFIEGYSVPTVWQPQARRFNSLFDEHGVAIYASLRNLDHYEFNREPGEAQRLRVTSRAAGTFGGTPLPLETTGEDEIPAYRLSDWKPPLEPGDARRLPDGSLVAVSGRLFARRSSPVRLCPFLTEKTSPRMTQAECRERFFADLLPECGVDAPRVLDAARTSAPSPVERLFSFAGRDPPAAALTASGPFLVRVSAGEFSHAILLDYIFPVAVPTERPEATPRHWCMTAD